MHFVEMKVKTQFTIQDTVLQVEKPIDISLLAVMYRAILFLIFSSALFKREPFSCYSLL